MQGDPDAAFAGAARVIEAEYEVPFQGHTAIGPAHALADPSDGQMTIYSNDMKSYGLRNGVAKFLGMPRENVRVVYMDGPQVYGRTAADDAGFEAAFLAHELGRPVRVQWTRHEETAWDTKGPAHVFKLRGGLDAQGKLVALEYDARALDYNHLWLQRARHRADRAAHGQAAREAREGSAETPSVMYAIPNRRMTTRVVALPHDLGDAAAHRQPARSERAAGDVRLRVVHRRAGGGGQGRPGAVPPRHAGAGQGRRRFPQGALACRGPGAARRLWMGHATVAAARATASRADVLVGRGIAYTYRSNTIVAVIAEVEVNRQTGEVWAKRLVCAHDCGLVINPEGLRHTVECGMLHALSRALWEEVRFDTEKVTSVDWASYPSLRHSDTPAAIDVVLVNGDPNPDRPDLAPYGAGECSHKPLIAAIANAIHDATGVRLRRPPFRSERVLAALKAASA